MSGSREPRTDCGCCEGGGLQAPQIVDNRPGLTAIEYRVGTHSTFKASMLSRLSAADLPALNSLTTRSDLDFTIALLDAWAAVGDVLTFYQERIANESYLRTATERRSLAELANLIGYVPRPGVAAGTYLAFTIEQTGVPEDVPVPAGIRVQSIPGPGEKPQVFETVEAVEGRPEWNEMRPLMAQKHPDLAPETKTVSLQGTGTNLRKGESVLLLCGAGAGNRVVKRVLRVVADPAAGKTRVDLAEDPPNPPTLHFIKLPIALWRAAPVKLTGPIVQSHILSGSWRQADLKAFAAVQRWPLRKLSRNINLQVAAQRKELPAETGFFALRQRTSIFGHNAPKYDSLPQPPPSTTNWENRTLSQEPGSNNNEIDLDTTYPGIVKGSWLVLESQSRRTVYQVQDNSELSRADFTLAAKVSRVKLNSKDDFASYKLRETSVLADSDRLELADLPVTDVVKDNSVILDGSYLGLVPGRHVVVSGNRTDLPGVADSEIMELAEVNLDRGHTELVFVTTLDHEYERASVTVNANVARATHGETREQPLGAGDGSRAFQRFALPEAPVTHVSAANAEGAVTTLVVRVNGVRWDEVKFLYAHGPGERIYTSRTDDDGRTFVQFGDGRTGARVPTGQENVTATYRKGMGAEGLVSENQLSLVLTKLLGIRGVTNPVDAADAADGDGRDDIRRNAALPILTLDRIVSLTDYEDFARAFTGIAKALSTWTWNGHQRGVFLTVAGTLGKEVPEGSTIYDNLLSALLAAGDQNIPLRVRTFSPAFFQLSAVVGVDPAYETEPVLKAVESALRARFSFHSRSFGQPVAKSEVIAAIQAVEGVVAVDLNELVRTDEAVAGASTNQPAERLIARVPLAGTDVTVAAELLLLDPRPVSLGVMSP